MSDKNFKVKNGIDANGAVTITQPTTSTVPLTILANTLATGSNLLEIKRPDGTVRFAVGNDGALTVNSNISFNGGSMAMYPGNSGQTALTVFGQTNQSVANLIVRAATGQSGNLQEWRDQSGNLAVSIGADFALRGIAGGFFGTASGNIVGVNYLGVKGWAASHIPFVVQGFASQTGDLTRWVDSNANTLAKVDASGSITAVDLTLSGNLTVNGTTTNLNSTNLIIEDKNIIIADVATPTDTTADGAGITIKGATDKTFNWVQSTGRFTSSESLEIAKGTHARLRINDKDGFTAGIDLVTNFPGYADVTSKILFDFYGSSSIQTITGNAGHGMHYLSARSGFGNHWFRKSTTDGVQLAILDAGNVGINTTAPTSALQINSLATGTIGLIIKSIASQTSDLQQWQSSDGSYLAGVDKNGYIRTPLVEARPTNPGLYGVAIAANASQSGDLFQITDASNNAYTGVSSTGKLVTGNTTNASRFTQLTSAALGQLTVYAPTASTIGTVIRGASSQTANLQEWQNNNGQVRAKIDSYGGFSSLATTTISNDLNGNGTALVVQTKDAGGIPIAVKGFTSQTADLQQWQNSAGAALAKVDASGNIIGSNLYYTYTLPDTPNSGVSWMLLGTWSTIQNGSSLKISIDGKTGYNAQTGQLWNSELYFVTSNDSSGTTALDSNVFYGNGLAYRNMDLGSNISNTDPRFRVLQNSKTSYSIYIKAYQWLGSSAYKVSFSQGTSWLNSSTRYGDTAPTGTVIEIVPTPSLSSNGGTGIIVDTTTKIGLFIKGAPSQTANLQEWQNSAGTVLNSIASDGTIKSATQVWHKSTSDNLDRLYYEGNSNTYYKTGNGHVFRNANDTTHLTINSVGNVLVNGFTASTVGLIVKNASSQTANSFEIQSDTSTPIFLINGGSFSGSGTVSVGNTGLAGSSFGSQLYVQNNGTSRVGITVKGTSGQTASLQEWQNSSSTVISKISADGSQIWYNPSNSSVLASISQYGEIFSQGNVYIRSAGDYGASLNITTPVITKIGAVIRGMSGQTANLQEWQNSSGSLLSAINQYGSIITYSGIYSSAAVGFGASIGNYGAQVNVNTTSASNIGVVVRGATSQTANLQEWQNSGGTVLAKVNQSGEGTFSGKVSIGSDMGAALNVLPYTASQTGAIVRSAPSQTANLQEWQNSAGTVLTRIGSDGAIYRGATTIDSYGAIYTTETIAIGATMNQRFASGGLTIINRENASAVILGIKGFASQTADLTQWRNSSDTVIAKVDTYGNYISSGLIITPSLGTFANATAQIKGTSSSNSVLALQPNSGSSTGDALTYYNSSGSAVLAKIDYAGNITATSYNLSNSLYSVRKNIKKTIDPASAANANNTYDLFEMNFPSSLQGTFSMQVSIRGPGYGQSMSYTLPATYVMDWIGQYGLTNPFTDSTTWVDLTPITFSPRHLMTTDYLKLQARVSSNTIYFRIKLTGTLTGSPLFDVYMQHSEEFANSTITELSSTGTDATTSNVMPNFLSSKAGISAIFNPLTITASAAANVPLTIKGAGSQTASLQEWKNSSSTLIAAIRNDGTLRVPAIISNTNYSSYITLADGSPVKVSALASGVVGLVVQAAASQTANLQEWQNSSGTILAGVTNLGSIDISSASGTSVGTGTGLGDKISLYQDIFGIGIQSGRIVGYVNALTDGFAVRVKASSGNRSSGSDGVALLGNGSIVQTLASAAVVGLIVKGAVSQTANLQEWQNSGGTVLALVDAYGRLGINTTSLANSTGGYSMVSIYNNNTVNTNLVIKSYPSQTATLTEWQNSSGTTLAKIDVLGNFTATSKSFDIVHPTKENMRLRYGSLEGPENGVYVRGTVESNIIELPDYWTGLVHEDSITVSLTSVGSAQNIYVEKIENNKIYIGGNLEKAFFTVYGERKDIDNLTVEY